MCLEQHSPDIILREQKKIKVLNLVKINFEII